MKTKEIYKCSACGASSPKWQGQCPSCGAWNTLKTVTVTKGPGRALTSVMADGAKPVMLEDLKSEQGRAATTGMKGLDRLLGGGLVPGGAMLIGGEPGIGKSTLLLQVAGEQARLGRKVVYFSGEESLDQIRSRAMRLNMLGNGLPAIASTRTEDALDLLESPNPPDLLIVDSVQTLSSPLADGIPGSVSQVRAVSGQLVEAVKKTGTTLVLVGHVTKEGHIAGPKLLEHMVDTVLYLEGDRYRFSRILRVLKNRFGPSDELLVMNMTGTGLEIVEDPATFFLGERDATLSGTALAMAIDGSRPFAVEVQALASKTYLPVPRRNALGFDTGRLNLLLAVLEKRLGLNLSSLDIHAKISGGLNPRDPGLDVAMAAAILSSMYDRPLPEGAVFWGEIDLNGQIRPAPGQEIRLKQAEQLGYNPVFHPGTCKVLSGLQIGLFGK